MENLAKSNDDKCQEWLICIEKYMNSFFNCNINCFYYLFFEIWTSKRNRWHMVLLGNCSKEKLLANLPINQTPKFFVIVLPSLIKKLFVKLFKAYKATIRLSQLLSGTNKKAYQPFLRIFY